MKVCTYCKQSKELDEFHKNSARKDGRQTYCKLCAGPRRKQYYESQSDVERARTKALKAQRRLENKEKAITYLRLHPCVDCGEDDPVVLEFDHVTGKKLKEVSVMLHEGLAWETVEAEIQKCQVRCANCHRRKTAKERGTLRYNKAVKGV